MKINDDTWKLSLKTLPQLEDIKLLHVSNATHYYPLHIHEEYCIAIILQGTETHICRGEHYKAFPGNLYRLALRILFLDVE